MLEKEEIIRVCKEIFIKHEVLTVNDDVIIIEQKIDSIDSLTNVNILMDIEEYFDFTLPDEYLAEKILSNMESLIGLIKELSEK